VQALRRGLVGTTGGFSEYMRVFSRQAVQGLWLTGFDVAAGGDELTITGRTLNAELVPTYIQHLNREAAIQGRNFGSMLIKQALNRDALQTTAVKEGAAAPFLIYVFPFRAAARLLAICRARFSASDPQDVVSPAVITVPLFRS